MVLMVNLIYQILLYNLKQYQYSRLLLRLTRTLITMNRILLIKTNTLPLCFIFGTTMENKNAP